MSFRNSASFGKRMEYYIIGLMLREGLDCYVPLIDDDGIDLIIRKNDNTFIEIQIKARSKDVTEGDTAFFAAITHTLRENYFFVFYSQRMDIIWIMSSEEYLDNCVTIKNGKNKGKTSIKLNGKRKNIKLDEYEEYILPRFEKYIAKDFSRFK